MTQWIRTALLGAVLGTVLILSPQRALAEEAGGEAEKGSFWEEILQDVNWEGIRDGVQEGLQTIGAEAAEKAEQLEAQGKELISEIKTQAEGYAEELAPYVEQAKTAARQAIGEAGEKLEQAKTAAQQVIGEAGAKLEQAKAAARQAIGEAGEKLEQAKTAARQYAGVARAKFEQVAEEVREAWPGYRDAAIEWVNAEKTKAGLKLQTLCEWLQEKLGGLKGKPATPAN